MRKAGTTGGAFLCFGLCLAFGCGNFGNNEMELIYAGEILTRGQTKALLRAGVEINYTQCPQNTNAGIYAVNTVVPDEVSRMHYRKSSVQACFLLLAAAPCGLNPDANVTILGNLYRAVIRGCYLQGVGL